MNAEEIAFVKLVGIKQNKDNVSLEYKNDVQNHIQTIHASAPFTLAETQSGLHLQKLFPNLVGKVIPILRNSAMKYKKPALKKILAQASTKEEDVTKFEEQFKKKRRGTLQVSVLVVDIDGISIAEGTFGWFISQI